jgi:hypothetical protein
VLLAGLFPWAPAVALLVRRKIYDDVRILWLALWIVYGLIFFSAARNKLPGYVLPLLPAIAIVLAVAIDKASQFWRTVWLAACACLLVLLPTAGRVLPQALLSGLGRSHIIFAAGGLLFIIAAAVVGFLAWQQRTEIAVVSVALAAAIGIVYLKSTALPILDRTVSVRPFWMTNQIRLESACLGPIRRTWEYGLDYYVAREIPHCAPNGEPRPQVNGAEGVLSLVVPGDK